MEQTDSWQRAGALGNWVKEGEGINQKHIYHIDTDNSVVITKGKGS